MAWPAACWVHGWGLSKARASARCGTLQRRCSQRPNLHTRPAPVGVHTTAALKDRVRPRPLDTDALAALRTPGPECACAPREPCHARTGPHRAQRLPLGPAHLGARRAAHRGELGGARGARCAGGRRPRPGRRLVFGAALRCACCGQAWSMHAGLLAWQQKLAQSAAQLRTVSPCMCTSCGEQESLAQCCTSCWTRRDTLRCRRAPRLAASKSQGCAG